ncbi:MAG: ABC transporter substrate-binding protein [Bacillota bacterium]
MKQNFRITLLTVVFILTMSLVVGAQNTTVTMLYWPGPESEAMQEVVDEYNSTQGQEDGIEVEMLTFSRQGFFDKQQTALAGKTKNFDIAFPPTYILGRLAPHLEPLEPYFEEHGKLDNLDIYIDSALDSLSYQDQLYALPTDVGFHMMFYRQDLIDELATNEEWQQKYAEITEEYLGEAYEPKDPEDWTWDDYVAYSLFFTRSINPESPTQYGTTLQLKNLIFNVMIWNDVLFSYDGKIVGDGESVLNSPAAEKALDVYMKIIKNNATPSSSINYEFAETNEAFKSGQTATIIQYVAAYPILTNEEESPRVYDKVGRAPVPAGSEGHKVHVHNLGVGLNKYSDNKEEASKFLTYLATTDAMEMYHENGGLPPVTGVINDVYAQNIDEYGFTEYIGRETTPIFEEMARYLGEAWSNQMSPEEALQAADEAVNDVLAD